MKKKLILGLLILISLFAVAGCACSKKKESKPVEPVLAEDEVVIRNKTYKLNKDTEGYGISYKTAENFVFRDSGNALNYFGEKNDDNTSDFVIRIFHYKNKTLDYAIKDTVTEYDSKTEVEVNGVKYTKLHFVNYNNANTYLFYYVKGKDVYVFCFTAWEEQTRLEEVFLKQVVYEKAN